MLSKKFFVEHANEHVKKMIRHKVRPYPIKNALQENLQNKVQLEINLIDRLVYPIRTVWLIASTSGPTL